MGDKSKLPELSPLYRVVDAKEEHQDKICILQDCALGIDLCFPLPTPYLFEPLTLANGKKPLALFSSLQKNGIERREEEETTYFLQGEKRQGQCCFFYAEGQLKGEVFYATGMLEGPATFYSKEGWVLSESLFYQGKLQGEARQYYHVVGRQGSLYSLQRHKEGLKTGLQEYYYPDGKLKSSIPYREGQLEGEVTLFWPNGQKKRETHYSSGKKAGVEYFWNAKGELQT